MLLRFLILAILASLAASTRSQEMPMVLPNNYVLSDILNRHRIDASIAVPARRGAATATHYQPSPTVSARVRREFVASMSEKAGTDEARQVAVAMARTDPMGNWSKLVAADGLRPNDMADALAAYWILNWVMANGADSTRLQALAVRGQVRAILTASSHARMDDAKRQELSETFILNFLIQHAAYMAATQGGDRDARRRLGDAAAARFRKEMGIDLRHLRLTDTGFVPATAGP